MKEEGNPGFLLINVGERETTARHSIEKLLSEKLVCVGGKTYLYN